MRFFVLASVVGASCLVLVASACSSSDASNGTDSGVNSSDADLTTGDGGRKDGLNNGEAGACLASTGSAPTCAGVCAAECQIAVSTFKPDVATSIDTCLSGRVDAAGSDSDCQTAAGGCVDVAANAACADDNAASFCTTFLASCTDVEDGGTDATQQDCVSVIQGMSDDGRNALQSCTTAQGGACGTCLTELNTLTLTGSH